MAAINLIFANNAQTIIAGSISPTSLVVNLAAGTGALFPDPNPSNDEYFVATFTDASTGVLREIIWCTARTGDTLTIVRAREGTAAQAWAANDLFAELWTAGQAANGVQIPAAQAAAWNFGQDTGAANAYVCALSPAVPNAPGSGFVVRLKALNTNTAASTLDAGFGAVSIKRHDGSALIGNEIVANHLTEFEYNATAGQWQVMQPAPATAAAITAGTDDWSFITPDQLNTALGNQKLLSGQCYFSRSTGTACALLPFNGNGVPNQGNMLALPAAGVTVANTGVTINGTSSSNLAANTNYLVALNASVALEFWTLATGHTRSSTSGNVGVEIITGHNDKTLIGMVRTDGSAQFVDNDGSLFVLSWFNPRLKKSRTNFDTDKTYGATTVGEIDVTIRNSFLTWARYPVAWSNMGAVAAASSGQQAMTSIGFDGTSPEVEATVFTGMHTNTEGSATVGMANFSGEKAGLSESNHYATLLGLSIGGTSGWYGGNNVISASQNPVNSLTIQVMG